MSTLAPLVWPLVTDEAIVYGPIPGNNVVASVRILHRGKYTTLSVDQYEQLRTGVLIPISQQFHLKPLTLRGDFQRLSGAIEDLRGQSVCQPVSP